RRYQHQRQDEGEAHGGCPSICDRRRNAEDHRPHCLWELWPELSERATPGPLEEVFRGAELELARKRPSLDLGERSTGDLDPIALDPDQILMPGRRIEGRDPIQPLDGARLPELPELPDDELVPVGRVAAVVLGLLLHLVEQLEEMEPDLLRI